jgi:DHA1 family bicyclomycin/chloramphenicol resistance-like MFS transporter
VRIDGFRVDLHRLLPPGHADHGQGTACRRRRDGTDHCGLPHRLQQRAIGLGTAGGSLRRKRPIAIGLLLFIIGSIGCALAGSASAIIVWRIVQACGACAGVVLSRAMVRDVYGAERSGAMLSTLITVMAVAPLVGPLLGGQILLLAGWRAIFWVLVIIGLLTGAGLATIPETLPPAHRSHRDMAGVMAGYAALLRDGRVMTCAMVGGFYYFGVYAYVAGSPFAFITFSHVPPQLYGLIFGAGIVAIMLANMANVRLLPHFGGLRLIRWGHWPRRRRGWCLPLPPGRNGAACGAWHWPASSMSAHRG